MFIFIIGIVSCFSLLLGVGDLILILIDFISYKMAGGKMGIVKYFKHKL